MSVSLVPSLLLPQSLRGGCLGMRLTEHHTQVLKHIIPYSAATCSNTAAIGRGAVWIHV